MHRVGRTGRFGTDGLALTFVLKGDEEEPQFIEKMAEYYAIEIKELKKFDEFDKIY